MTRRSSLFAASVFASMLSAVVALGAPSAAPQTTDLTPQFRSAGLPIDQLHVYEVGGVVLIRGRAADRGTAEQAGILAQTLGYTRIANLVQVVTPPDDAAIRRRAERELTVHRSLEGCSFRVDSQKGIVRVAGTVQYEVQKDEAIAVLRTIDGVREVQSDLRRR